MKNKKGGLKIFFNKLLKIVKTAHSKWNRMESKAIAQIFNQINQEISLFNNDLNQISHKLSSIMIGKIHMLTIFMVWKLEVDNITKKK